MAGQMSHLGTGWAFPPTFVREEASSDSPRCADRGRVEMAAGEIDIRQSLEILFNTALGERVMQPAYGADLKRHVFEAMNAAALTFIEDLLRTAIVYHEPRIETERLAVQPDDLEGRLLIEIDYLIRGTNSRFNFVYPFYTTETGQQP